MSKSELEQEVEKIKLNLTLYKDNPNQFDFWSRIYIETMDELKAVS